MDHTERERTGNRDVNGLSLIGGITGDLVRNAVTLVRNEIRMAGAEITSQISSAGKNSTLVTIGAVFAFAGLLYLLLAATAGLAILIPVPLAALAVGGATFILGGIILIAGKRRLRADVIPRETIDTVKEDTKWMRNQLT